jgi:SagB-type dehydrogenase family enzyme
MERRAAVVEGRRTLLRVGLGALAAAVGACTTGGLGRSGGAPVVPASPAVGSVILPDLPPPAGPPIEAAIVGRRSVRAYGDRGLRLQELARLLYYADGVTEPDRQLRAAPSAGALYPIEVYAAVAKVDGLAAGVYRSSPASRVLEPVRSGSVRAELHRAALAQATVRDAPVVLVLTGVLERLRPRYAERAERYLLLEAGHIAQNVYLEAGGLGLACCALGAFDDDAVNRLLGVDARVERALYLLAVGAPRTA